MPKHPAPLNLTSAGLLVLAPGGMCLLTWPPRQGLREGKKRPKRLRAVSEKLAGVLGCEAGRGALLNYFFCFQLDFEI